MFEKAVFQIIFIYLTITSYFFSVKNSNYLVYFQLYKYHGKQNENYCKQIRELITMVYKELVTTDKLLILLLIPTVI